MKPVDSARAAQILIALYCLEVSAAVILIGFYKTPAIDQSILLSRGGIALLAGVIGVVAAMSQMARHLTSNPSPRAFVIALSVNALTVIIAVLLSETLVRTFAVRSGDGIVIGSVEVRPTWLELRERSRKAFSGTSPREDSDTSYFVYDRSLGWTVGRNRRSRNGLYLSSVEGVRSARPDIRMLGEEARYRVAMVGDSHAFSLEVPFEESWGHYLQQLLGDEVQVANFGVNGYGIDQMYLRYRRDVQPWSPHIVLIGFVGHDLLRTMAVYPFVSFGWPGYLVKPRFSLDRGELRVLNVPLPTPDEIFSTGRIDALPFVEHDLGYGRSEWYWRFDNGPLFLRYLTSAIPRWTAPDPRVSEDATIALNSAILVRLVREIEEAGAVPILVDLTAGDATLSRRTIETAGVKALDGPACWSQVPQNRRWAPSGFHQSGLANRAVAICTMPEIERALGR